MPFLFVGYFFKIDIDILCITVYTVHIQGGGNSYYQVNITRQKRFLLDVKMENNKILTDAQKGKKQNPDR